MGDSHQQRGERCIRLNRFSSSPVQKDIPGDEQFIFPAQFRIGNDEKEGALTEFPVVLCVIQLPDTVKLLIRHFERSTDLPRVQKVDDIRIR